MHKLLTATQVAKTVSLSAVKFNEILYAKNVINKRGRPGKKDPKVMKPFWELVEHEFGKNMPNFHGGGTVKFYENKVSALLSRVGLGGIL